MKKAILFFVIGLVSINLFSLNAQILQGNSSLGVQAGYCLNLQSHNFECCNCSCCPTHCPETAKGYYFGLNYQLPIGLTNLGLNAKLNYYFTSYQSIRDLGGEYAKYYIENVDNPVLKFTQTISTSTIILDLLASYDFSGLKLYGGFSVGNYIRARGKYEADIISPENATFSDNSRHKELYPERDIEENNNFLAGASFGLEYNFAISDTFFAGPEIYMMVPFTKFIDDYGWKTIFLNFGASIKMKL